METKICSTCKEEKPISNFFFKKTENRYNSMCKTCLYVYQKKRWVELKKHWVKEFGGKCSKCGYNKNYAALEFHHVDPSTKEFKWDKLRLHPPEIMIKELAKCILVCSNCHKEIHYPHATF